MLKGTGHYDFIDICVLLPIEVSMLFRRENSGPLLWDKKKTRDKLLQTPWLMMEFMQKVGLSNEMANAQTISRNLSDTRENHVYEMQVQKE